METLKSIGVVILLIGLLMFAGYAIKECANGNNNACEFLGDD